VKKTKKHDPKPTFQTLEPAVLDRVTGGELTLPIKK
jgi:hypothetical protein